MPTLLDMYTIIDSYPSEWGPPPSIPPRYTPSPEPALVQSKHFGSQGLFTPAPSPYQPNQSSSHGSSNSESSSSLRQPTPKASQPNPMNSTSAKDQISSIPSSTAVASTHYNRHESTTMNPPPPLPPPVKRGRGRPKKILLAATPEGQEKTKGKRGRPPKKRPRDASLSEGKHPRKKKA